MLSFHKVRETVATGIVSFLHIPGALNMADVLSKHWGCQQIWSLLQPLLFWDGDTLDIPEKGTKLEEKKDDSDPSLSVNCSHCLFVLD